MPGLDTSDGSHVPNDGALLSIDSINDVYVAWVNNEIKFLEKLAAESTQITKHRTKTKKDDVVDLLAEAAGKATSTSKLLRLLFRLATSSQSNEQLCNEVVKAVSSTLLDTKTIETTYAEKLKLKLPTPRQTGNKYAATEASDDSNLSPKAPIFAPKTQHEVTIIPQESVENDMKAIKKTL